jgi:hypothetical protein
MHTLNTTFCNCSAFLENGELNCDLVCVPGMPGSIACLDIIGADDPLSSGL